MAKSCLKSLGEDLEVSSIIQSREVLQAAGVEEVFVCCLTGAASRPGEGRRFAVHFGSCFEADSGDSISSQAFGWEICLDSSLLLSLLQDVDSSLCHTS